MEIKGKFACKTDIGLVRETNEDKALSLIDPEGNILLCVCDGMGGYMKGDFASKIAIDTVSAAFTGKRKFIFHFQVKHWIEKVIQSINYSVYSESQDSENFKGMGTTLCMALLFKDKIYVVNVGDSRCYVVLDDKLEQVTRDQTYVEYQLARHEINEDEKRTSKDRHALMNFLGKKEVANYELKVIENQRKTILLCSDGLYNNASNKQIFSSASTNERLDQKINTLIGIAKANGGTDNIAISMWEPIKND